MTYSKSERFIYISFKLKNYCLVLKIYTFFVVTFKERLYYGIKYFQSCYIVTNNFIVLY